MAKIINAPNQVLSEVSKEYVFKKGDKYLSELLKDMETALLLASDPKGVGLAAPQIGISLAIFIAKPTETSPITTYINPFIIDTVKVKKSPKKRIKKLEGCLSLQSIWGEVLRSPSVTLVYFDENGKQKTKKFIGFMATIVQHEVDHLNGILFPKRVLEQRGKLYKSTKNEDNEDEFEELKI